MLARKRGRHRQHVPSVDSDRERRSARVVNYLQQKCGWAPYRMLTPTGMSESDPAADNETAQGRAQNRRVAVNILVSKAVDGIEAGG